MSLALVELRMPTLECACGYTCGSSKAWLRHADRFDGDEAHRILDPSLLSSGAPVQASGLSRHQDSDFRDVLKGVGRALLDEERGAQILETSLGSWRRSIEKIAPINGKVSLALGHAQLPLVKAARQGNLHTIQTLLSEASDASSGGQLDALDEAGITALGWAAKNGHDAIVAALIEAGACISAMATHPDAQPPLYLALTKGRAGAATLLLQAKADPREREPLRGQSALHAAVAQPTLGDDREHATLLEWVLQLTVRSSNMDGPDALPADDDHCTPLHAACRRGDTECVRLLLAHCDAVDLEPQAHASTHAHYDAAGSEYP